MHPCTVESLDMRDFQQYTQQVKFNVLKVQMFFWCGRHMVLLLVTALLTVHCRCFCWLHYDALLALFVLTASLSGQLVLLVLVASACSQAVPRVLTVSLYSMLALLVLTACLYSQVVLLALAASLYIN